MRGQAPVQSRRLALFKGPFCQAWSLRASSALGGQVLAFAIALQMYQTSHSALDLGLIGLVQFFPALLFALPAGHMVDRIGPGRAAVLVQGVNCAAAALLLLQAPVAHMPLVVIFAAALLTGASRAFEHPIHTALLPSVVANPNIGAAVAWTASIGKAATLAGPILGGALYAFGPRASYGAALALFLAASAVAVMLCSLGRPDSAPAKASGSAFSGIGVVWRDRVLSGAMTVDLVAVLLGGATALLPIFAMDILHTTPVGLGVMRAAPGLGALATGLWLGRRPVTRSAGQILLLATGLFGLATCVFGLSRSYFLSLGALTCIGATDMVSIHIRSALVQLRTPPHLRGRVGALNGIFISSSNQIGAFESGVTAQWFGAAPAVAVGGLATIAATFLVAFTFLALRSVDGFYDDRALENMGGAGAPTQEPDQRGALARRDQRH